MIRGSSSSQALTRTIRRQSAHYKLCVLTDKDCKPSIVTFPEFIHWCLLIIITLPSRTMPNILRHLIPYISSTPLRPDLRQNQNPTPDHETI